MNLGYISIILVFFLAILELIKNMYSKGKVTKWLIILSIILLTIIAVVNIGIIQEEEKWRRINSGLLETPRIDLQKPFEVNVGSNILTKKITESDNEIDLRQIVDLRYWSEPLFCTIS